MTKCDFCQEELLQGGVPACVAGCPTRALQFGEYDELVARHGAGTCMAPLPSPGLTEPRLVLALHKAAKPVQTRAGGIGNPEEVRDA